jgi:hypothetical protein
VMDDRRLRALIDSAEEHCDLFGATRSQRITYR